MNSIVRRTLRPIKFGLVGTTVLALVTWLPATAVAQPNSHPAKDHLVGDSNGFVLVSEQMKADGSVTDSWTRSDGTAVKVSGDAGLTVTLDPQTTAQTASATKGAHARVVHTLSASVSGPKVTPTKSQLFGAVAGYIASGRSVVRDAMAVGMSPAQAAAQSPKALATLVFESWCVTTAYQQVSTQACDYATFDYKGSNGDWYIADHQQASGVSTDTSWWSPKRLTQIYVYVSYPAGNQIVQWKPGGTAYEPSSCAQVTIGFTSQATGIGISETDTICSDWFGPYTLSTSTSSPRFGTQWNGLEPGANWWEHTEAIDLLHSPPTANAYYPVLHVSQSYCDLWC